MTANNKVLTVSYGTFSCTLEGFDDSFETMKLIAEYFRDLAAEDRYFGAEPPAPDAEMLAEIAKRDVARHVEARNEEGQIHLSARPAATAATGAAISSTLVDDDADADAAVNVVSEDVQFEFSDTPSEDMAPLAEDETPEIDVAPVAEEPRGAVTEVPSVAERLMRIRSVVADEQDPAPVVVDEEYSEDEHAYAEDDVATGSIEAAFADLSDAEDKTVGSETEDAVHDDLSVETTPIVEAAADDAEEALDIEELAHAPFDFEETKEADDDLSAMLARIESEDTDLAVETSEDASGDTQALIAGFMDDAEEEVSPQEVLIREAAEVLEATEADEAFEAEAEAEAEAEPLVLSAEDKATDIDEAPAPEDAQTEAAPEPERVQLKPRKARVLKIKRTDLSKAFEAGRLEEATDDVATEAPFEGAAVSSLSAEEEAELSAELARVHETPDDSDVPHDNELEELVEAAAEAEASGSFEDDTVIMQELPPIDELVAQAGVQPDEEGDDELDAEPEAEFATDVNRLMDKANQQMDEPETTKRRNAFQALKAAVAARKADIGLGGGGEAEREEQQKSEEYRSDLAQVVKPDRKDSVAEDTPTAEAGPRPAPLRLVAEQRIDAVAEEALTESLETVAAERQVAEGDAEDDEAQFTAYVDKLGAHDLPDLLEAAASYLAHVEGKEQFSRPQLMAKVRMIAGADYSREAGLRSFGQLLRAGKIEKIRGGRFTVTSETGFRPDARVAG